MTVSLQSATRRLAMWPAGSHFGDVGFQPVSIMLTLIPSGQNFVSWPPRVNIACPFEVGPNSSGSVDSLRCQAACAVWQYPQWSQSFRSAPCVLARTKKKFSQGPKRTCRCLADRFGCPRPLHFLATSCIFLVFPASRSLTAVQQTVTFPNKVGPIP